MDFDVTSSVQESLDAAIADLPNQMLRQLVKKKLKEQGVKIKSKFVDAVIDKLMAGDEDFVDIDDDWIKGDAPKSEKITLVFGEDDIDFLNKGQEKFSKQIPEFVNELVRWGAKKYAKLLRADFNEKRQFNLAEMASFHARLEYQWREGLRPLEIMLYIALEYGRQRHQKMEEETEGLMSSKDRALIALHIRGGQVIAEVLALLKAGFADGAMGRWRTLFEIVVVATVLSDENEDTAQKYLDHSVVEAKKTADRIVEYADENADLPFSDEEFQELSKKYDNFITKYGKEFKGDYGWAAECIGNRNPKFSQLIDLAEKSGNQTIYKVASCNVHANSRALFFRHTNFAQHAGAISGASNVGLQEPGAHTAYSLVQLAALLMPTDEPKLDDLIQLHALMRLRDSAELGFMNAAKELEDNANEFSRILEVHSDY